MARETEQQRRAKERSEQEKELLLAKVSVDVALEEVQDEKMDCGIEVSDDSDTDWDEFED